MPEKAQEWNREDRDLLIELRTEMKGVRTDIKNLSDGNNERLRLLEQGKLDRTEANRLQSEALSIQTDHDKRIRIIEDGFIDSRSKMKAFFAIGASLFAAFQVIVQVALSYFHS